MKYPKELYELVNVTFSESVRSGNNPFSRSSIVTPGELPPVVYEYPFFNSFVAIAFSVFTGGNLFAAHYLVSVLCIIGTGIIGASFVKKYAVTTVGPAFALVMLMICHWRYGYGTTGPDSLALFLTVLVLWVASNDRIKYRELLCAVGLILIFYTKWYMVTICVSLFLFRMLYDKKSAFKLLGWCVGLTSLSIVIVTMWMPLVWNHSVFHLMCTSVADSFTTRLTRAFGQLGFLSFIFAGIYLVIIIAIIKLILNRKKTDLKQLLYGNESLVLLIINIVVQLPFMAFFAGNDGAYLTYPLQMLYPSVVLVGIIMIEKMMNDKILFGLCYASVVLFTVYFGWRKLPTHILTDDEIATWEKAYAFIYEKREEGEVYHTPQTAYDGVKKGDSTFYTGHDDAVSKEALQKWEENHFYQIVIPDEPELYEEMSAYIDVVSDKIRKHDVSLMIRGEHEVYISKDLLTESGYYNCMTLDLRVGNMYYPTEFWIKKDK